MQPGHLLLGLFGDAATEARMEGAGLPRRQCWEAVRALGGASRPPSAPPDVPPLLRPLLDRARRVAEVAGQGALGRAHLLGAALADAPDTARLLRALTTLALDLAALRRTANRLIADCERGPVPDPARLSLTPGARGIVVALAPAVAARLGHAEVSAEHVFLALLGGRDRVGALLASTCPGEPAVAEAIARARS